MTSLSPLESRSHFLISSVISGHYFFLNFLPFPDCLSTVDHSTCYARASIGKYIKLSFGKELGLSSYSVSSRTQLLVLGFSLSASLTPWIVRCTHLLVLSVPNSDLPKLSPPSPHLSPGKDTPTCQQSHPWRSPGLVATCHRVMGHWTQTERTLLLFNLIPV